MVTLYLHSEDVLEILNSGSLELPGTENVYAQQPEYIKEMLNDPELTKNEYGPVTQSVLPYISAERVAVNGLFGASSVVYEIKAPDLESWLVSLDPASITTSDDLLLQLEEYIKIAPVRTARATVRYYRPSIFSIEWQGNYNTREFADAVCGGFNSAYNVLYQRALEEMEAMFA